MPFSAVASKSKSVAQRFSPQRNAARSCGLLLWRELEQRSINRARGKRGIEREGRDLDIEMLARRRHHAIAADHEAGRRRQWNPAGIFERLAGPEERVPADHTRPLDLLQPPERVGDTPMAGLELHRLACQIGDVDGVGPEVITVARRRPLRNEARRHRDLHLSGYAPVHLINAIQFYEA